MRWELLSLGRMEYRNLFNHLIPVYDLERTICDLVRSRSFLARADSEIWSKDGCITMGMI